MKEQLRMPAMIVLLLLAATSTGFAQQEKGDSELGLNGAFTIPHSDPGGATGEANITYGYYFTQHDLIGVGGLIVVSNSSQTFGPEGRYRHLFSTGNPKVFPFLGVSAGVNINHFSGAFTNDFIGVGEAGVKFFVSQRTAFEVAYNFQYLHAGGLPSVPGFNDSFSQNTQSIITFGFTHLFGGHHK